MRNLIRAGVPQSVALKISGHRDTRVFSRYNIVDPRDVAEAMRKLSLYEQEKRLSRARRALDVCTSFTEAVSESKKPAFPKPNS